MVVVVGGEVQLGVSGQSPQFPETVFPSSSTIVEHQDTPRRLPSVVQLLYVSPLYLKGNTHWSPGFGPLDVIHGVAVVVVVVVVVEVVAIVVSDGCRS